MNVAGLNMGHVLVPGSVKVRGLGSSLPNCPLCLPTSDNNVFHRLTAAKLFGQGQLSEPVEQNITKQSFSVISWPPNDTAWKICFSFHSFDPLEWEGSKGRNIFLMIEVAHDKI